MSDILERLSGQTVGVGLNRDAMEEIVQLREEVDRLNGAHEIVVRSRNKEADRADEAEAKAKNLRTALRRVATYMGASPHYVKRVARRALGIGD